MEWGPITETGAAERLLEALKPLVGVEIGHLRIPADVAENFEPSQIGTIVGTLTDAVLPSIALEKKIGLNKGDGILGDREGYPDFEHVAGYRLELKGLFRDNPDVKLKKPPTIREPSARLTQKVTKKNVHPEKDALLILSYQLQPTKDRPELLSPVICDVAVFPVIECVNARDHRLESSGGVWFGEYETPAILSKVGKGKLALAKELDRSAFGRKESEGRDFNEDTNFGKLKRIPYKPLQEFLAKNGSSFSAKGTYPSPWAIAGFESVSPDVDD